MKKRAILGIDLQNDFVLINGALSVNGAAEDAKRIGAFISNNKKDIHHISLHFIHITLCTLQTLSIGKIKMAIILHRSQ